MNDLARDSLTIAVCTHNRSRDLSGCLDALLTPEIGDTTILVIDSASSPSEKLAIEAIVEARPNARLIRLDAPGISFARNTAAENATTEWLAYIDDDIVAACDWMVNARRLLAAAPRNCAVIGGRVDPIYPDGMQPSVGPRWRQLLSLIQIDGEGDQTEHAQVVSGNALFRREVLLAVGAFPPQLGRVGKTLLSGEEKLAVDRLRDGGARIFYSDRLRVGHKIGKDRLERKWASLRAYWDGVTDQKIRRLEGKPNKPWHLLKLIASIPVLGLLYPLHAPGQEFFLRFWYNVGFLRERFASIALKAETPSPAPLASGTPASRIVQA